MLCNCLTLPRCKVVECSAVQSETITTSLQCDAECHRLKRANKVADVAVPSEEPLRKREGTAKRTKSKTSSESVAPPRTLELTDMILLTCLVLWFGCSLPPR